MGSDKSVSELLHDTVNRLQTAGIADPDLEAALLIGHFLNLKRADLFLAGDQPVPAPLFQVINKAVIARLERLPLAYVLGEQEFFSRTFEVDANVLIPRSETELLVEKTVSAAASSARPKILDLGCGSGVIAVTLALELPHALIFTVDLSYNALHAAAANVSIHQVGERVHLLNSDWFAAIKGRPFDYVVSNPPYVAENVRKTLQPELAFEPSMALFAGPTGTDEIDRILGGLATILKPGGWLFMEIGYDQGEYVRNLLNSFGNYDSVMVHKDYAGLDRIVQARIVD